MAIILPDGYSLNPVSPMVFCQSKLPSSSSFTSQASVRFRLKFSSAPQTINPPSLAGAMSRNPSSAAISNVKQLRPCCPLFLFFPPVCHQPLSQPRPCITRELPLSPFSPPPNLSSRREPSALRGKTRMLGPRRADGSLRDDKFGGGGKGDRGSTGVTA
jgi:hypothetical protein